MPLELIMSRLKSFAIGGFFLACSVVICLMFGSDILSDYEHRHAHFEPARDVRLSAGACRSKLALLSWCQLSLTSSAAGSQPRQIAYFIAGGLDGASVRPLRAAGSAPLQQRYVTTDVGIENLTNRIAAFAGLLLVSLLLTVTGFVGVLDGAKADAHGRR